MRPWNRRSFLTATGLVVPSILSGRLSRWLEMDSELGISLFFNEERLPALRDAYRSARFADLRERMEAFDLRDERRFLTEEVNTNDKLFHMLRLYNTASDLGFHYLMTQDEESGEIARDAVRTIMRFPKWDYFQEDNGKHVIGIQRASGATVGVSLCADWLGDLIDADERADWMRTMGERGCEPSFLCIYGMRYKDRVVGWSVDKDSEYFVHRPNDVIDLSNWPTILDRTNLKAVPASALAIGAVAYEKVLGPDEDSARWLEQAAFSVDSFRDLYAPDGSYDENMSYANYTGIHLAQAIDILEGHGVADLYDGVNWRGFMDFATEMSLPTISTPSDIVNFGDAKSGLKSALPFWISAKSRNGRGNWFANKFETETIPWSLIWEDPTVRPSAPPDGPHIWKSDLDWIVGRTGYDADDLVVAMRSGGPANHEHADRNSIIVKCFGEQLVVDPERPPYSYSDPSWMLRTTAGHSALLIDGEGHQYHDGSEGTNPSDAWARVVRLEEDSRHLAWTSDASEAYAMVNDEISSVTRTVIVLVESRLTVVVDRVLFETNEHELEARFFAYNKDGLGQVYAGAPSGIEIVRPHAAMRITSWTDGSLGYSQTTLPIPREVANMHPSGSSRSSSDGKEITLVSVLEPARTRQPGSISFVHDGDQITVAQRGDDQMRVINRGSIPEYEVLA